MAEEGQGVNIKKVQGGEEEEEEDKNGGRRKKRTWQMKRRKRIILKLGELRMRKGWEHNTWA